MATGTINLHDYVIDITDSITVRQNTGYEPNLDYVVVRCGKTVQISGTVECSTPYGSFPGEELLSGLPKGPTLHASLYPSWSGVGDFPARLRLADGKLYLRAGKAGASYDINITYLCY